MSRIKKKVTQSEKGTINASAAEIHGLKEPRQYSIGFKYFNDSLCVLKDVNVKISRKIHEIYRNMGKCVSPLDMRQKLPHDIKPIQNSGHYKKYYKNITEDTEVHEFDVGVCRGFFFYDESNKIIQMLAIDHHPEDRKSKK